MIGWLQNLDVAIDSFLDFDAMLDRIVESLKDSSGFQRVILSLLDPATETLKIKSTAGIGSQELESLRQHEVPFSQIVMFMRKELKVGNAESLPFHDKTFDCVVSTGSIHHWKNPIAGLNEIHRILKDEHRALIYDLVRKLPKDVSQQVKEEFGSFRLALLWLHSFEEPFLDTDEMLSIAKESSFQGADIWFRGALCCIGLKKEKSR